MSRAKIQSKRQAKRNRKKLAQVARALKMPADDVNRYLNSKVLQVGDTLDSRVKQLSVERDVRSGLGVQPTAGAFAREVNGKGNASAGEVGAHRGGALILERETNDEALAILKQKEILMAE